MTASAAVGSLSERRSGAARPAFILHHGRPASRQPIARHLRPLCPGAVLQGCEAALCRAVPAAGPEPQGLQALLRQVKGETQLLEGQSAVDQTGQTSISPRLPARKGLHQKQGTKNQQNVFWPLFTLPQSTVTTLGFLILVCLRLAHIIRVDTQVSQVLAFYFRTVSLSCGNRPSHELMFKVKATLKILRKSPA